MVLCPGGFKSSLHKIDVACRNRSRCSGLALKLEFPVAFRFAGTDEEREVVDGLRFLVCGYSPRVCGVGEVVLPGEFGVITRARIWVGEGLGRDVESAERAPSAEGRRELGESTEGRLTFSPGVGVVRPCRDVGDLALVGKEGRVGEGGESGRWLVLADPREAPNLREGGDGDSGTSNRSTCLGVFIGSRWRMEVGVCVNVGFCFEVVLDSLAVSLDDRRGVNGLGPLIEGRGCGLDNFDRVRCGETRTSTLEVEETTSGI